MPRPPRQIPAIPALHGSRVAHARRTARSTPTARPTRPPSSEATFPPHPLVPLFFCGLEGGIRPSRKGRRPARLGSKPARPRTRPASPAERAGFEPAELFQVRTLSKRVPSTARPPLLSKSAMPFRGRARIYTNEPQSSTRSDHRHPRPAPPHPDPRFFGALRSFTHRRPCSAPPFRSHRRRRRRQRASSGCCRSHHRRAEVADGGRPPRLRRRSPWLPSSGRLPASHQTTSAPPPPPGIRTPLERMLGSAIGAEAWCGGEASHAGDLHDGSRLSLAHTRQHRAGERDRAEEHRVHHRAELLVARLFQRADDADAGVVHHHVDVAEARARSRSKPPASAK